MSGLLAFGLGLALGVGTGLLHWRIAARREARRVQRMWRRIGRDLAHEGLLAPDEALAVAHRAACAVCREAYHRVTH
mgnify:CR=1 FL=1